MVSPLALLSHFFFSGAVLPYSSCSLFLGMIFLYISLLSILLILSDILSSLLSCFSYILIHSIPPTCFIFSVKSSLFIYFWQINSWEEKGFEPWMFALETPKCASWAIMFLALNLLLLNFFPSIYSATSCHTLNQYLIRRGHTSNFEGVLKRARLNRDV